MECNFNDTSTIVKFILCLLVNVTGFILTLTSIVLVILNGALEISLRSILISYSVANLIGIAFIVCDILSSICDGNIRSFMAISVLLTLTHLLILLLVEYVILTSSTRRRLQNFTGLLIIAWIISISLGIVITVTDSPVHRNVGRLVFSIGFMVVVLAIVATFVLVLQKHHDVRERFLSFRRKQVNLAHHRDNSVKRYWKLYHPTIILISYILCGLPWVLKELYEGVTTKKAVKDFNFAVLFIYSINFYWPSAVCIHLWLAKRKNRRIVPIE